MGRFWFPGTPILHSRRTGHRSGRNAVLVADLQHRAGMGTDDGRGTAARLARPASRGDLPAGRAQAQA
nr:hypothetical protein [Xanthomonas citri]